MTLTDSNLTQIGQVVDESIKRLLPELLPPMIQDSLKPLESDVAELKTDMTVIKNDVSQLKTDVSVLKTDVSTLKTDVSTIKQFQTSQTSTMKFIQSDVRKLKELSLKQGILLEDLDHRFRAEGELYGTA